MSLPTLTKTWQFQVNIQVTAQGTVLTTSRLLMRLIKDSLLGTGSWTDSAGSSTASTTNWTVVGSSNSVAAALDATDRWAADANLVWATAGSNHSWIVLKQTGVSSNFQVLIDLSNGTATNATIKFSPSVGFTGGSITTAPTATDSVTVINNVNWGSSSPDANTKYHVMKASDGSSTRVIIHRNNQNVALWAFEKPVNTVTGWSNPSAVYAIGSSSSAPASGVITSANFMNVQTNGYAFGASSMNLFMVTEGKQTSSILIASAVANDLSSEFPIFPIGCYSETASNRGRHGSLTDLWAGLSVMTEADTYPATGTLRQFVQFGILVFQWNQSVPSILP